MTISHALRAVLRRWWVVVAVVALASAAAGVFVALQPSTYSSTATVKINPAFLSTSADSTNVFVDTDPDALTSPTVLERIAQSTGAEPEALATGFSAEFAQNPTTQGQSTTLLAITTVAPTAAQAQAWAAAFVQAYHDELTAQIDQARAALEQRRDNAITEAGTYQEQLTSNPNDPIVSASLTSALSSLAAVNDDLATIDAWGEPVSIQDEASLGVSLSAPLSTVLAIAAICGLIAAIGVVLIWEQLDDRVRREDDLSRLPGVPFLGGLSYQRDAARGRNPLPTTTTEHSALSEGLRALRTTLQVLLPPEKAVVAITSVEPGDGKTFVSANLAIAWAAAGRRVVLVGGDLRRPELTSYFGPHVGGSGLAELLSESLASDVIPEDTRVHSLLIDTAHRNVQILPAGHAKGDPADLLALPALGEIVVQLTDTADIVILDSPPAMIMADASLLARAADGVVLLTTLGRTRRTDLSEVISLLRSHDVPLLGVVGNRSRKQLRRSYSGYYADTADEDPAPSDSTHGPGGAPFGAASDVAPSTPLRRHRREARPPI